MTSFLFFSCFLLHSPKPGTMLHLFPSNINTFFLFLLLNIYRILPFFCYFFTICRTLSRQIFLWIFLPREKTALSDCFFEEFSYENVSSIKRKLLPFSQMKRGFLFSVCSLHLMILLYAWNVSKVCRFSKRILKNSKVFFLITLSFI